MRRLQDEGGGSFAGRFARVRLAGSLGPADASGGGVPRPSRATGVRSQMSHHPFELLQLDERAGGGRRRRASEDVVLKRIEGAVGRDGKCGRITAGGLLDRGGEARPA